jgi:hypothetical protein
MEPKSTTLPTGNRPIGAQKSAKKVHERVFNFRKEPIFNPDNDQTLLVLPRENWRECLVGEHDNNWDPGQNALAEGVLLVACETQELDSNARRDVSVDICSVKVHRCKAASVTIIFKALVSHCRAALLPINSKGTAQAQATFADLFLAALIM